MFETRCAPLDVLPLSESFHNWGDAKSTHTRGALKKQQERESSSSRAWKEREPLICISARIKNELLLLGSSTWNRWFGISRLALARTEPAFEPRVAVEAKAVSELLCIKGVQLF